nr:L-ascorbate peroxidase [Chlamydomonas sp. UWO 241]
MMRSGTPPSSCRGIVLLLAATALLGSARCAKTKLNPGMYGSNTAAQACLDLTWAEASQRLRGQTVPNCLRMSFHDAGTYSTATDEGGANGSILNELDFSVFPQNAGLTDCPAAIAAIRARVAAGGCPAITAADVIQVAGAVAVALSGGPSCPMLMGRPDTPGTDLTAGLPSTCDSGATGVDRFMLMGFSNPTLAVVVLSGAHNIGRSRATPRDTCNRGLGPLTANDNSFDGHYYTEVVDNTGRRGWFDSDRALNNANTSPSTATLVRAFAADRQLFLNAWCAQYQEMSLLGVDTSVAGFAVTDGWLRA